MPYLALWLSKPQPGEGGGQGRGVGAAGDCGHVVVPAHLKYTFILRLWYSICQPYDSSIHRITHNIVF